MNDNTFFLFQNEIIGFDHTIFDVIPCDENGEPMTFCEYSDIMRTKKVKAKYLIEQDQIRIHEESEDLIKEEKIETEDQKTKKTK